MKKIRIKFCDWYAGYNERTHWLGKILMKYYDVEFCDDNPDYVFFSAFGYEHLNYDCVKIYYTAEDLTPDFNLCDYAIGFDYITFEDRYLRFPLYCAQPGFEDATKKHLFTEDDLKNKTEFCEFIVSNAKGTPLRTEFFHKLSEYKKVNSGGKYLNNIGAPLDSKTEFQKKHKFSIVFENGSHRGYTTEKIIHAFEAQEIPIYWGDPTISSQFNPKSFINANDYDNLDDVVKRVIEIDNDEELYRSILSEPIFVGGITPDEYKFEALENYLKYVFDQPLEKAPRRGHYTTRDLRINDLKRYKKIIDTSEKLIPKAVLKLFG